MSDDVKVKKPDPRIFNLALEKLKIKAQNAVFIGDHLTNDVLGAIDAGLHAVWLRGFSSSNHQGQKPQHIIDDLQELEKLIERI